MLFPFMSKKCSTLRIFSRKKKATSLNMQRGELYYVRPNVVLAISQTKTWGIYIPYTPPRTARISGPKY